jgi:predicted cobalt transporter CbtA
MLFRRLVLSGLLVGLVAGLVLSAVQRWQVIPIIEQAERFEQARAPEASEAHAHAGHGDGEAWVATRLRQLEEENRRLRSLVADLTLSNQALKQVVEKKW